MGSHRHSSSGTREHSSGLFMQLWRSFWNRPEQACPKCGCEDTDYYDPFFFAPVRSFKGKRRIQCTHCHFIWRPSRKGKSLWERFKPSF